MEEKWKQVFKRTKKKVNNKLLVYDFIVGEHKVRNF